MALDGWSNCHNEPIICVTVSTLDGTVHLIDTVDTSGMPHTAEYLVEVATGSMQKAKETFGCQVRSIVTDHAANVAKMRRILEEQNEDLVTYGCSAHLLNLLAHDVEIPDVKEHILQIMKYFRNNHFAAARYRQGGQCLIIPQDVRWNTMADCLEAYIKNWPILMTICEADREKIDLNIRNKVTNLGVKRAAEDLLARLRHISVALDKVQRDNCTIGEAVTIWKDLESKLPENSDIKKRWRARYAQAMTPAHFLANLLLPSSQGMILSDEGENEALEYAERKLPPLIAIIMKFQARSSPFQAFKFSESVTESVSAAEWWMSHQDQVDDACLSVVLQLFSAFASSAGVERVFSSYGLVHSKLRNRLGKEKAAKLVFLFKAMNKN